MEIARREQKNPIYRAPDFLRRNKEVMFHIALAKFQQNPKLRRWLLESDRAKQDSPIFHTDEDSFWGLGPLQEDGQYRGKNWNGKILMLVRCVLREAAAPSGRSRTAELAPQAAARLPLDPFPPLGPPDQDEQQGSVMRQGYRLLCESMRRLAPAPGGLDPSPFPKGTLIAQRYRVLDHIDTGPASPPLRTDTEMISFRPCISSAFARAPSRLRCRRRAGRARGQVLLCVRGHGAPDGPAGAAAAAAHSQL